MSRVTWEGSRALGVLLRLSIRRSDHLLPFPPPVHNYGIDSRPHTLALKLGPVRPPAGPPARPVQSSTPPPACSAPAAVVVVVGLDQEALEKGQVGPRRRQGHPPELWLLGGHLDRSVDGHSLCVSFPQPQRVNFRPILRSPFLLAGLWGASPRSPIAARTSPPYS